jgi:uncharacterized protein
MKALRSFASAAGLLILLSCVTVNIYFPEAAAEQALRGVARDILDKETAPDTGEPQATEPQSSLSPSVNVLGRHLMMAIAMLIPAAHAQGQPDINVQTPVALKLRGSLKARHDKLEPYYKSGAIGLSSNALPVPRELNKVPLQERVSLKKLLSDDAKDRAALFSEIARANGHPEWESNLRETFQRVFFEEVPAGYWYQDGQGAWRQKGS